MSLSYALFKKNADACENAKHPSCRCHCGGKFHGQSHAAALPDLWRAYRERQQPELQLDPGGLVERSAGRCPICGGRDCKNPHAP